MPENPTKNLLGVLKTVGPGIVFALTAIGPGDLVSNAVTGATHGYLLLWALALSLLFRFVWLDASARYVMATGESLLEGYARFGNWLAWLLLGALTIVRLLSNLYMIVLLADTVRLVAPSAWLPHRLVLGAIAALAAFLICDRGGYRALEKSFKLLIAAMGAALLIAVLLSKPDAAAMARGLLIPSLPADRGLYATAFILLALVGTEAGSLTNITYSYFLRQKGWCDPTYQSSQRKDLLFTVASMFAISAATQIAAAGTLLPSGVSPRNAADLVTMFTQALGSVGLAIFSFGLCAAAFSTLAGATTGYALVACDVVQGLRGPVLNAGKRSSPLRPWIAFWCFAPLPLMALTDRPVWLVLLVSSVMAACIPVLALFLLLLTSDRQRMGTLVNGRAVQAAFVALIAASAILLIGNMMQFMPRATLP
jgi:Mn2+/Fe2+ NRAMP family transporter